MLARTSLLSRTEVRFDKKSDLLRLDGTNTPTPNCAVRYLDEPCDFSIARIDIGNLSFNQLALLRLERVEAKKEDSIEFGLHVLLGGFGRDVR